MHDIVYRYEKRARRPGTWGLLGLAFGLEIFAVSANAPWYFYVIWGVATALLLWYLWTSPQTVLQLTTSHLHTRQGEDEHVFELSGVKSLSYSAPDGKSIGTLRLHDTEGGAHTLPLDHIPPLRDLRAALATQDIPLHLS